MTISILVNDSDVDGNALIVASLTEPTHGTTVINPDNTITYTPDSNYHGADSFNYTIHDGNDGTATAAVSITVTPVNDAPVTVDDTATTNEDTIVIVLVLGNDNDVDGDMLSVTVTVAPTLGTATVNPDNSITYTPQANIHGMDSFTYTVHDGAGGTDVAVVTLNIIPINDPPTAVNDTGNVDEDTAVTVAVLANDTDVDGDILTVQSVSQPGNGSVIINPDSTLTYTPDSNYHGADTFTYTVVDGNGGTATADVTIAVNPVNDEPVTANDAAVTVEDTAVTIIVLDNDTDVDGDLLYVTSVTTPTHGLVTVNPDNSLTYVPEVNFNGQDSFAYTISDGHSAMDTATVVITVTAVNDVPIAIDDAVTTDEDTAVIIPVLTNDSDVDGDMLLVDSVTQPISGTVVINPDNTVTYTPATGFSGADSFSYTINDGQGATDTATVTVNVTAVNNNPDAVDDAVVTNEDTAVTITVLANDSDSDGDGLIVVSVTPATVGTVSINPDSSITYIPDADVNGSDSFSYTISDGQGGSDTATVHVTITPINDSPSATDDTAATDENTTVTINVLANDSDSDGDVLSVTDVTQPAHGLVSINGDGSLAYSPNTDFNGTDTFVYTVSDGHGGVDTAVVTIDVLPVATSCELYPIALHADTLLGVQPGNVLPDIFNGTEPGNFGWLSWTGNNNVPTLIASLTPSGNSYNYINPNNPNDHTISIEDWIEGKPGVSNAKNVRNALDELIGMDIVVPIWNATQGNGANTVYQTSGFATVRILDYHLPGQDSITAQFLGMASCTE